MQNYLENKVILITGGSSGFGLEAARLVLERGARVTITGRDQTRLTQAEKALAARKNLLAVSADVTSSTDWQRAMESTTSRFGHLDVLVNNAGAGIKIAPTEAMDDDTIRQVIDTNLTGVIFGCRAAVGVMKPRGKGLIVNVTSGCCYRSWASWAIYTAAKAGLVGFTKCLCKEMLEWGGRASLFVPGAARTNFCKAAGIDDSWLQGYPEAVDYARSLVHMIDVPDHCLVEELSIWGTEQVRTMLNPY
jgi:NAD(P)-dependent dehydrogenase (short-subunit alcohol dehydrogenase family)